MGIAEQRLRAGVMDWRVPIAWGVGRSAWSTFSNPAMDNMRIENAGPRRICRPVPTPPGARPDYANCGVGGAVETSGIGGS